MRDVLPGAFDWLGRHATARYRLDARLAGAPGQLGGLVGGAKRRAVGGRCDQRSAAATATDDGRVDGGVLAGEVGLLALGPLGDDGADAAGGEAVDERPS